MRTSFRWIAVVAASLLAGCYLHGSPGDGEKIGQIVKISKGGIFSETWSGQIMRGGLSGGSGTMGTAFNFTIEDSELVPLVQAAMRSQQEVRITYHSEGVCSAFRTDSDEGCDFLRTIEPIGEKK